MQFYLIAQCKFPIENKEKSRKKHKGNKNYPISQTRGDHCYTC